MRLLKCVSMLGKSGGEKCVTEHLKKRGFQLVSRCPLCGKAEDELNHILIHCPSV